jgi:hypothetical protein
MVNKVLERDRTDVLREIKSRYRPSFHENVSNSQLMEEFYRKAILVSGVVEKINKSKEPVMVVDIAGGRGRVVEILKELTHKEFNSVVVDRSREELGKDDWKLKVIVDMTHLPIADKKADVVFLLNSPSSVGVIKEHIVNTKPASRAEWEESKKVLVFLGFTSGAIDMVNVLEGVRILKNDGVFVEGMLYSKGGVNELKDILEGIQTTLKEKGINIGEVPLERDRFEIFELDAKVAKDWRKYGIEIGEPKFFVESYRKTGAKLDGWVGEVRKSLEYCLEQLSKTERFWKVIDEMEMSKKS